MPNTVARLLAHLGRVLLCRRRLRHTSDRVTLSVMPMESRDHTGSLAGGVALAALGFHITDPLDAMMLAVGDNALFNVPLDNEPTPVTAGDPPVPVNQWLPDNLSGFAIGLDAPVSAQSSEPDVVTYPASDFWLPEESGSASLSVPAAEPFPSVMAPSGEGSGGNTPPVTSDDATPFLAQSLIDTDAAASLVLSSQAAQTALSSLTVSPAPSVPTAGLRSASPPVPFAALVTPPTVTVSASDKTASETAGNPGQFTFKRTGNASKSLTIPFSLSGTAAADDFNLAEGAGGTISPSGNTRTLTFSPGSRKAIVTLNAVDDSLNEQAETAIVTIPAATDGLYLLGTPSSGQVQILDNDTPPTVTVRASDKTCLLYTSPSPRD